MNSTPAVSTPPKLTKRQEAFIHALIKNGGNVNQAALDAGYSSKAAPVMGWQNLRLSHVKEAYKSLIETRLAAGKALSLKVLEDVARTSGSDRAKVAAADSIWAKAMHLEGIGQGSTGGVTINIGMSRPSDPGATQTIDVTAQVIDNQGVITSNDGDTSS